MLGVDPREHEPRDPGLLGARDRLAHGTARHRQLVAALAHRLDEDEAFELAQDLTVNLVRKAYRL